MPRQNEIKIFDPPTKARDETETLRNKKKTFMSWLGVEGRRARRRWRWRALLVQLNGFVVVIFESMSD